MSPVLLLLTVIWLPVPGAFGQKLTDAGGENEPRHEVDCHSDPIARMTRSTNGG